MRDTVILYDILVTGIELPAAHSGRPSIARPEAILHCGRIQVSGRARKNESRNARGSRHKGFAISSRPSAKAFRKSYLRWRGIEANASAVAIDEFEGRSSSVSGKEKRAARSFSAMQMYQRRRRRGARRAGKATVPRKEPRPPKPHGALGGGGENAGPAGLAPPAEKDAAC